MKKLLFVFGTFFILTTVLVAGFLVFSKFNRPQPKPTPLVQAEDIQITLIEGWTLPDIAEYLEEQGLVSAQDFLKISQSFDTTPYPTVHAREKNSGLEGYIFPDTYRIPKIPNSSATSNKIITESILKRALQNFENKLSDEMLQQAQRLNMNTHEIVTLASIIERETGRNITNTSQREELEKERGIVSGIFHNRLKIGMPLQSDATVNYVTGKDTPSATYADLEIDSPYNTYKYAGLPPGPIANPSLSSLKAALKPTPTEYLYFLHKQPSGEIFYGKTLDEHIRNRNR